MRLRLLLLLAIVRIRLAPAWLRAQPRRRPWHTGIAAVLGPLLLAAVVAAVLDPAAARGCYHPPTRFSAQARMTCADAAPNRP